MEAAVLAVRSEPSLDLRLRLDRARSVVGSDPTADIMLPDLPPAALQIIRLGPDRFRVDHLDGGPSEEVGLERPFTWGRYRFELILPPDSTEPPPGLRTSTAALSERQRPTASRLELELEPGRPVVLNPGENVSMGSSDETDVSVPAPHVSGFHCRIQWNEDRGWTVVDLGSTNGTFLQGIRIQQAELPASGILELADHPVPFRIGTGPPSDLATYHGMVGASPAIKQVFALLPKIARNREPVLVHGESGTGKELVARAIHEESGRQGPFLALNCGALNPTLVESELFGHVKGSFTGAVSDRKGAFEACQGGTLFLDEIGELPIDLQPKLLRVLESGAVRRIGDREERPVDVRIVAATHRNLEEAVQEGSFREDLFFRLFVLSVALPPLRERPEDIEHLAHGFLAARATTGLRFSPDALFRLREHPWPGNVRELKNVVTRALVLSEGPEIGPDDLIFSPRAFTAQRPSVRKVVEMDEGREKARMLEALARTGGNRSEAARLLGVSKSTFFDRLKRFGITDTPEAEGSPPPS